jgi:hypothetical protein
MSERQSPSSEDAMRRCGRCQAIKPVDDFMWRRKERGQRDNYCRPCRADYHHEHYVANRARYIENTARRKRALAEERNAYLVEFFVTHPCTDCGETDPLVLEFDHQGDKCFNVSAGVRDRNWQAVLDEIAKCEVVCANCHRRRTAAARGFFRAAAADAADRDDQFGGRLT